MVKIKFNDRELTMPEASEAFSLGELSLIKKHYGVSGDQMSTEKEIDGEMQDVIDLGDPDVLQGYIFTLLCRLEPKRLVADVAKEVASINKVEYEAVDDDPETDPRPKAKRKPAGKHGVEGSEGGS